MKKKITILTCNSATRNTVQPDGYLTILQCVLDAKRPLLEGGKGEEDILITLSSDNWEWVKRGELLVFGNEISDYNYTGSPVLVDDEFG